VSDTEEPEVAGSGGPVGADAAALALALGSASTAIADEFLAQQTTLSRLQAERCRHEIPFEHSHLRWRQFEDRMKGATRLVLVAVGALLLGAIGLAIWEARQAEGLVVDAFSVPPAFAASGVTADVLADDLTTRLAAIRDFANDNSLARSKDVRQDRDQDIKVEIPDTGISLSQVWRYLRQWLGHERRLGGNLRDLGGNRIALTAALDGDNAFTLSGRSDDLEGLEQQAAEQIFARVDPVNYVLYLRGKGRSGEGLAAVARLPLLATNPTELSEAYSLWANAVHYGTGDLALAGARARLAIQLDPKTAASHMEFMGVASALGHDEDALVQARLIPGLRKEDEPVWRNSDGVAYVKELAAFNLDLLTGDFLHALSRPCQYLCVGVASRSVDLQRAEYAARTHDIGRSRLLTGEAAAAGALDPVQLPRARYFMNAAAADWVAAAVSARAYSAAIKANRSAARLGEVEASTQAAPLLATALARGGDFAAAHRTIDATPADCYPCLLARGNIDALEKNWDAADSWFARAVAVAPSIPFAHEDWGRSLLARARADDAIAQFTLANQKAPHFADALEGWGEALMAKNQSHLALAKFAEAEKYAPNWGRLHLKWGEALFYSGRKDEAKAQFARAANLDLTLTEKAEWRRVS